MKRRNFLSGLALGSGALALSPFQQLSAKEGLSRKVSVSENNRSYQADVIIAGGGLGGCASALAALRNGLSVVMTEETDWIGGQITQQGVPPDEHPWIETHGAPESYRYFRTAVREYYKNNYPLTEEAASKEFLNPGDGSVSRLCHEPKVALAVLHAMLAPFESTGKLVLLLNHQIKSADYQGTRVKSLTAKSLLSGKEVLLTAPYFVDATELGDLLPLTKTAYVTGTESKAETGNSMPP
jgi:hypothetical protein